MTEPQRFTTKPPVPFFIDDDEFHVLGAIPAEEFAALMDLQEGLGAEGSNNREQYAQIKGILQFVMLPESWGRFEPKLADREHPVDFNLLVRITNWLTGTVWSGKAEGSPSPQPSTDPSVTDGPTSTGSAPSTESTPSETTTVSVT